MAVIGKNHQVICITHLAQIAAMADAHFLIEKGVPQDKLPEIFKEAAEARKDGSTVCVTMMKKNKKFQKEQLEADGYTSFTDFYREALKN